MSQLSIDIGRRLLMYVSIEVKYSTASAFLETRQGYCVMKINITLTPV